MSHDTAGEAVFAGSRDPGVVDEVVVFANAYRKAKGIACQIFVLAGF